MQCLLIAISLQGDNDSVPTTASSTVRNKDVNKKLQGATVSTSVTAMSYCKLKAEWKL